MQFSRMYDILCTRSFIYEILFQNKMYANVLMYCRPTLNGMYCFILYNVKCSLF